VDCGLSRIETLRLSLSLGEEDTRKEATLRAVEYLRSELRLGFSCSASRSPVDGEFLEEKNLLLVFSTSAS